MRSHDSSSFDPSFRTAARSHRHSSIRDSTVTFLRNVFANRMSDYHSDAPPHELRNEAVSPAHQRGPNWAESGAVHDGSVVESSFMVVGGGGVNNNNNINRITEEPAEPFLWQRLTVRSDRRALFLDILYSRFWKTTLIIFAIILLFGAPCRALFIPKAGDSAVDAVFFFVFVFFVTDMGMRMDAEDHYFEISCGSGGKRQSTSWCCCRMGSFLFWCDFLSTFTLLADITWFNKQQFSESQFEITLNSFGIPVR